MIWVTQVSQSNLIYVDGAAALRAALSNADGGETIQLAAGDYGALTLGWGGIDLNLDPDGPGITIRSADPDAQAQFSNLTMRGMENVTFADLTFDYTAKKGDKISKSLGFVANSENISFSGVTFLGDPAISDNPADAGFPSGFGLRVRDSAGITIEDSEFAGLMKGVHLLDSQDIVLRGTEIHDFRSDGLNLVNVQNVLIEDNHIHSPQRSFLADDHADMVQMRSTATDPSEVSRDVTFRGNLLEIGEGDFAQGLFISNQPANKRGQAEDFAYRNLVIEDNVILGDHVNGIRVGATDGLVVRSNTLLHVRNEAAPNDLNLPPRIVLDTKSSDVTVTQNVSDALRNIPDRPDWEVRDNFAVQNTDPEGEGYYGTHFIGAEGTDMEAYRLQADSPISQANGGAEMLMPQPAPEEVPEEAVEVAEMRLIGGRSDDLLEGGAGDDSFLLRFGNDTATGAGGADTFILDWRYGETGDAHTITDLEFAEGDEVVLRFFEDRQIRIDSAADLDALIARDGVTASTEGDGLSLLLERSDGMQMQLTLVEATSLYDLF